MRIWDEKGFIPFELEVLTPVHIGSGEDFSPLEYVVHQTESDYEVWLIDTASWLAANHAEPRIARALEDGNMASLRGLLNGSADLASFVQARVRVASPQLGKELLQKRNAIERKAEVMAFARNPFTHMPYVPASSLKGAITTAVTDFLNEKRKGSKPTLRESPPGSYNGILNEIFGKIGEHAMQALKMADIALPPGVTSIREAIGVDLKPGNPLPKTPCEALDPKAANAARIYGNMRIASSHGQPALAFRDGSRIAVAELAKICNDFYRKRFEAEYARFYTKPHFKETGRLLAPVRERIGRLEKDREILLRVGRYSHIECVTVSGDPPPKPKGCGISRTLADHVFPFGWVILKRRAMAEYASGLAAVTAATRKEADDRAEAEQRARQQRQEAAAQVRREEEAAKERERELAALSPQEREIWELTQPTATENQAVAVFSKLQEFGDLQTRAAEALMQFWQRIGKWEGKQLTDKQRKKVASVRAILQS